MSLIKVLFISTFIFIGGQGQSFSSSYEKCDGLNAKAIVTQDAEKGIKVEIEANGGSAPYKYIFYKKSGHLLTEDFDKKELHKLEKGTYYCTVIEKKGCYKTIEFEIK